MRFEGFLDACLEHGWPCFEDGRRGPLGGYPHVVLFEGSATHVYLSPLLLTNAIGRSIS